MDITIKEKTTLGSYSCPYSSSICLLYIHRSCKFPQTRPEMNTASHHTLTEKHTSEALKNKSGLVQQQGSNMQQQALPNQLILQKRAN